VPLIDRLRTRFTGRIVQRFDGDSDHECFVVSVDEAAHDGPLHQLGFQAVRGFHPGHPA
jgi:hypothetical protein